MSSSTICLVGAGNMGGAMLAGWLESGVPAANLTIIDPSPRPEMAAFLQKAGLQAISKAEDNFIPDILIVAVKPQVMDAVLPGLAGLVGAKTVVLSVAGGTTVAAISRHLGRCPIIRAMPNTPALLRRGMTVCFANSLATQSQIALVDTLLKATSRVEWVEDEAQIDAVTAVSGSGPAYVFHLAECMTAAGIAEGLSPELANILARETIAGAGEMLARLDEEAGTLRKNVTSPNGTTAAALAVLMENGRMEKLLGEAIAAARKRSQELAENS